MLKWLALALVGVLTYLFWPRRRRLIETGRDLTPIAAWQTCEHCGGLIRFRNPSGYCDHLYYPENCSTCKENAELVMGISRC